MPSFLKNVNPVYVYTLIVDLVAVLVGFGLVMWSEAQQELILGLLASFILLVSGVSVPLARNVASVAQESYDLGVRDGKEIGQ